MSISSMDWKDGRESRNETELNLIIQCTPGTNVDVNIIDGLTTRVWTFVLARRRSTLDVCRNLWIHLIVSGIALNNMTKDALTHHAT